MLPAHTKASIRLSSVSWDEKAHKYKVVESSTDEADVNELDQYVFVARARIGKYHMIYPLPLRFYPNNEDR